MIVVCSIGLSALAPVALAAAPPRAERPAKAVPITLYGRFTSPNGWGFTAAGVTDPGPPIEVNQSDVITFTLFAPDNMLHNLVIDFDNDNSQDANENKSGDFQSATTSVTWQYVADRAGTFQYICGYHGGASMGGSFKVNSTGTAPPPASDNTLLLVGGIAVVVVVVAAAAAMVMRKRSKPPTQPPTQ